MIRRRIAALAFLASWSIGSACKPIGEAQESGLSSDAATFEEIVPADHMVWNLGTYLTKTKDSGEKKLAKHVGASGKGGLFFSSKADPLFPKAAAEEAARAKEAGVKATVKAFLAKEKVRLSTDLEVATSANLKIVATWWLDVSILTKRLVLNAPHTMEFVTEAGMTETDSAFKASASATFRAFGLDIKKYSVAPTKALSFTVPMPKLESNPIVYGVPDVGFTAQIGLKPVVKFNLDLDVRAKHMLGLTLIPQASIVAHIEAGAKATKALTANALGVLDIVSGQWPFSLTIGGSKTQNMIYGGATYDGQDFKAIGGRLVLVTKLGAKDGVFPLGLDQYLWSGVQALFAKVGITLPPVYKEWEFRHVIWESPPLILKKTPGYGGKAFYKIFNNTDGKKCEAGKAIITTHLANLKKEMAADGNASLKEVSASVQALLTKVKTKLDTGCKSPAK